MQDNEDTSIRRILVIDDNPDIFSDFQMVLQETENTPGLDKLNAELFGNETKDSPYVKTYGLDYASQGREGYEKVKEALAQNQPYNLAFVDMRMPPGWDGLETIEHIWQADPDIQIVICTAYSDYSWDEIIEKIGSSDNLLILKKPFDVVEVAQLASALTEKWYLSRQSSMKMEALDKKTKELTALTTQLQTEIAERKRAENKLTHQAYYDHLTNLPNRIQFIKHLGRMLEHKKWHKDYLFAVLFIDLDRFKVVNDSLGHLIGDKLLIEVSRRLETCTRPTDKISRATENDRVSRFGGDEFALFLNDIKDISSASRVADRIQMELQKPFNIDGYELFTSASIGISMSATEYENAEDILRDADSAMYRAKDAGRACAEIFDDEMHKKVCEMLQVESDLRVAVEKEQFMVYYQPIVSATDSRITGAEALIRWKHPEQGFISPMEFIPIAEETGLISRIGEWVLRKACAQNKAWQDAGYQHFLMKVNFSSRQFKDKNLTELIKKVIGETGMPAQLLDVEITETIAMDKSSINIFNQLTAMGLQTSIDDFGTGYSSLGSLTKFPINTIKIDRTFIKGLTIDANAEAIIRAIIAMAHSLKMDVIAEGVETEDQLAFLQSEKCDKIQGYLFSPPVPEEDFRKLLEKDKNSSPLIQKHSESMV